MTLAEQIAVLDGIDTSSLDVDDGRIGQTPALVAQYAKPTMPGVQMRRNVLDASEGANYSGGSTYAPGLPLMPSSVGLAGFGNIPGTLPMKRHVVDPSGGANYTGGASYAPRVPLLVSSAGLAQAANAPLVAGGYGSAGLGQNPNAPTVAGGYGAAGLGNALGSYTDQDLAGAFNGFEATRALDPADGRIGQTPAQTNQYAKPLMPGVQVRRNVIDASVGANYSGGSSYAPGLPLMPSSVGLAGMGLAAMDEVGDLAFMRKLGKIRGKVFLKGASRSKIRQLKGRIRSAQARMGRASKPVARMKAARDAQMAAMQLQSARSARAAVLHANIINGVPVAAARPYTPTMWK